MSRLSGQVSKDTRLYWSLSAEAGLFAVYQAVPGSLWFIEW